MPITGLPTFEDNEILTAGKLNTIVQALESKFNAITADDLTWPLVCQGNIDFDSLHSIDSLRTFWNFVNADEYDTLQLAIDAAEGMQGSSAVLIPPSTTITADTVDISASNTWIIGAGASSIIKTTSGASGGYLIRTSADTLTDIGIANLTIDGNNVSAQLGVQFRFVDGITVKNVDFKNCDGAALQFTHAGTAGTQKCQNAMVEGCRFEDGADAHISIKDLDGGSFANIVSTAGTATNIIAAEPSTSASFIKNLSFSNIRVEGPTGIGFSILGAGASNVLWSNIDISQVVVTDSTGDSFNIGLGSKVVKNVSMKGCEAIDCLGDAYAMNINVGRVVGCHGYNSAKDGMDLLVSDTLFIQGCDLSAADEKGIDFGTSTDVKVQGCDLTNATPANAYEAASATTPAIRDCAGAICAGAVNIDNTSRAKSSTGDFGYLYTIPGNAVKVGDVVRISFYNTYTDVGTSAGTMEVRVGGTGVAAVLGALVSMSFVTHIDIQINAVTGAGSFTVQDTHAIGVGLDDPYLHTLAIAVDTVDWTTDTDITFQLTGISGGSSMTVRGVTVEIIGAP
jgi:hypothetical protein